jgi:hypothetical protein
MYNNYLESPHVAWLRNAATIRREINIMPAGHNSEFKKFGCAVYTAIKPFQEN